MPPMLSLLPLRTVCVCLFVFGSPGVDDSTRGGGGGAKQEIAIHPNPPPPPLFPFPLRLAQPTPAAVASSPPPLFFSSAGNLFFPSPSRDSPPLLSITPWPVNGNPPLLGGARRQDASDPHPRVPRGLSHLSHCRGRGGGGRRLQDSDVLRNHCESLRGGKKGGGGNCPELTSRWPSKKMLFP